MDTLIDREWPVVVVPLPVHGGVDAGRGSRHVEVVTLVRRIEVLRAGQVQAADIQQVGLAAAGHVEVAAARARTRRPQPRNRVRAVGRPEVLIAAARIRGEDAPDVDAGRNSTDRPREDVAQRVDSNAGLDVLYPEDERIVQCRVSEHERSAEPEATGRARRGRDHGCGQGHQGGGQDGNARLAKWSLHRPGSSYLLKLNAAV